MGNVGRVGIENARGSVWGEVLQVSQKSATTYRCLHLIFFFFCWSRDWLRFARPSLFGTPLQEISNHLWCLHLIFVSYLLVSELPATI